MLNQPPVKGLAVWMDRLERRLIQHLDRPTSRAPSPPASNERFPPMAKRTPMNFEFTDNDRASLERLKNHWQVSRAEVLRRLLRTAEKHVLQFERMCPDARPCSCPHFLPSQPAAEEPPPAD